MQSIVLKKNVFSEGSEIVTLYTRELGKVRAVARSIKSPKSRLSFGLQSLFYTDVDLIISKKLSTIKGVKPIETFGGVYADQNKINLALYASEIILKSTADEQRNEQLFDLLLGFLEHLDKSEAVTHLCADFFALQSLAANGYALDFNACAVCQKKLFSEPKIYFSNHKNGFVCENCAMNISDANPVHLETYLALAQNQHLDFELIDKQKADPTELHRLAQSFTEHILERNLNSGAYLGTI